MASVKLTLKYICEGMRPLGSRIVVRLSITEFRCNHRYRHYATHIQYGNGEQTEQNIRTNVPDKDHHFIHGPTHGPTRESCRTCGVKQVVAAERAYEPCFPSFEAPVV